MTSSSRQIHPGKSSSVVVMPLRRGADGASVHLFPAEPIHRLLARSDVESFGSRMNKLKGSPKEKRTAFETLYSDICAGHVHFDRNQSLELLGTIFRKHGCAAWGTHLCQLGATRDATKSSSLRSQPVVEEKQEEKPPEPSAPAKPQPAESFSTRLKRADLPLVQISFAAAIIAVLAAIAAFKPLPKGEVRFPAPSKLELKYANAKPLKSLPPSEAYITNVPEVTMYMRGMTPEEAAAFRAKHPPKPPEEKTYIRGLTPKEEAEFRAKHPSKYGDGMHYITNVQR